jgi:GTP cyclohydrolase FolE2
MCGGDGWSVQYDIGSEHFESIRPHIAYAELSWDKWLD